MERYASIYFDRYQAKPSIPAPVNAYVGRQRVMYDEYEFSGAVIAAADTIKVGRLPKGARVLDAVVAFDDMGTTGVFDLGYRYVNDSSLTNDDNAFLDAVDVATAAGTVRMSDEANIVGFGLVMEDEADLEILFDTATTATSGKIRCMVTYVID